MEGLVGILLTLLVLGLVVGVVWWGVTTILGTGIIPPPINQVIYIIAVVLLVLIVVYVLVDLIPGHRIRL